VTFAVCYVDSFIFLYVNALCTSQKTRVASTVCYGDSFAFLHVGDCTSKETHVASTALYGDRFTCLYVDDVRITANTGLHGLLRG
jgi:hypothetical protein